MGGVDINLGRRLAMLRVMKTYHNDTAKRFGNDIKKLEEKLYDQMVGEGLAELKIAHTMIDPKTKEPVVVFSDLRGPLDIVVQRADE